MDPAERDRWRHELAATGAWVRRTPPARMVLPGLGCLGFTAVGVGLVATGTVVGWVVGGLAVAVFGLWFLPVVVWRAVTGKPVLRVDHGGLVVGRVAVPWAETAGLGFVGRGRGRTVLVGLDPAGVARRDTQVDLVDRVTMRLADRATRRPGVGIANGYGIAADDLADWVAEVRWRSTGRGWS